MKEAQFYQKLEKSVVQCNLCSHHCVMANQKTGLCGVRQNKDGVLYSLVYGQAIAEHVDPIEKKPLFHFLPGSQALSIATQGCNFSCQHCQNADISQFSKKTSLGDEVLGEDLPPEKVVEHALASGCKSIAYTYTEPTVFYEYALDTMKLAHKAGQKNCWITNGYITKEPLLKAIPYLDAANVDLKAFSAEFYQETCGAKLEPVLDTLRLLKKNKVWIEVTTLLIPEKNDNKKKLAELAQFIKDELGPETPWHISRFYPAHQMDNVLPTTVESIHKAYEIGKKAGLKYVYAGNIPGDNKENTFCAKCGALNIKRTGYEIARLDKDGKCFKCNSGLDLLFL